MGDVLQSVTILGAAIGALSCSKLLAMGKLKLIFVLNLLLVIGVAISLIGQKVWIMCVGRFIWGFAFGSFSVCCAKMVNEITPVELGGPFGAINQFSCTFGIALPTTLALAYPPVDEIAALPKDDFWITQYFRVIWSVPFLIAII